MQTTLLQGGFQLLPAKPGHCQVCAVQHGPEHAHNLQSVYYRVRFVGLYGRDPTWADAVGHCSAEVKEIWERELRKKKAWSETPQPIVEPIHADGTAAEVSRG